LLLLQVSDRCHSVLGQADQQFVETLRVSYKWFRTTVPAIFQQKMSHSYGASRKKEPTEIGGNIRRRVTYAYANGHLSEIGKQQLRSFPMSGPPTDSYFTLSQLIRYFLGAFSTLHPHTTEAITVTRYANSNR
jgi:hypothetical protein